MKITITPNLDKKYAHQYTEEICQHLKKIDAHVYMDTQYQSCFSHLDITFLPIEQAVQICDIMIAVGGDGTIIRSAKLSSQYGKKLLGINAGRVGYLAAMERNQLPLLSKLTTKDFVVEKRMMLETKLCKKDGSVLTFYSINDTVLYKDLHTTMIDYRVFCNHHQTGKYRGDGVIFSTPTGSTAYAFSVGGPVIDPSAEMIEMVPIASRAMLSRPILFSPKYEIEVHTDQRSKEHPAYLSVDGEPPVPIEEGDVILIRKADRTTDLLQLKEQVFFEILNEKIARSE